MVGVQDIEKRRMKMREILFKAKRIDNGEWVEGYVVKYGFTGKEKWHIVPSYASALYSYEVDENTICQYTGLTDKNGNKIWENDVVKKHFYTDYDACANSEEYIGTVQFTDCAWVIETIRGRYKCTRPIFEAMAYSEDVKHFEVIGNIFDNPELIGGDE